jgi:hypothetical protein
MKNIDNDTAARAIINACKTKFKSDSSGIQLDNSNNTLIVLACAGSEFEFKYDKSDIENSVYYKVEGTKFQWKKRKVYSFDSEQIIFGVSTTDDTFNRGRLDFKSNDIIIFSTTNTKTSKYFCYPK